MEFPPYVSTRHGWPVVGVEKVVINGVVVALFVTVVINGIVVGIVVIVVLTSLVDVSTD